MCGVIVSLVLIPVYVTGGGEEEGLAQIGVGNVVGKKRLWAGLIIDWVVCGVFLWRLWKGYGEFAELRRRYRKGVNPGNYAVVVQDIPNEFNSTKGIREFMEGFVPGLVSEVVRVRDAGFLVKYRGKFDKAVGSREKAEWVKENKGEGKAMMKPGVCGMCMCWKRKVDGVEYWYGEQMKWQTAIESGRQHVKRTHAAIVLLATRKAASFVSQSNFAGNSYEWNVSRAGEPKDVHWDAFKIPRWQVPWRKAAVLIVVMLLTLFWMVPVALVTGLASGDALTNNAAFSWLEPLFKSKAVGGLISGLLPSIILSVFLALVPTFIRMMVKQERLHSLHHIDAKTRTYYYIFNIFGQFLFILAGGAILEKLDEIREDPGQIPDLLASSIPKNAIFFATFIILNTFVPFGKELAAPARVIVRWLKLKFLAKTERQRRAVEAGGGDFPYYKAYGLTMLVSLLGVIYMSIAPVVSLCAMVFYLFAYPVYKYEVCYTTYRGWDGGGYDYRGAYWGIVVGLVVKQLTMIGYYGVKKSPAHVILSVIPLVIIAFVSVFCVRRFGRVVKHGSLADLVNDEGKGVPSVYLGQYEHPGLKEIGEVKNLNGIVPFDADYVDGDESDYTGDDPMNDDVEALKPSYRKEKIVE